MKLFQATKRKKPSLLATLCFLTALALLLSGGAVTLARYIMETRKEGTAVAKPFYFSSDKLEEGSPDAPYYQLDSIDGKTVEIRFQLRNYVDKLRCTDSPFSCTYTVTADGGEVLQGPETVSFSGGGQQEKSFSCTASADHFADGKEVTVTAVTQSPYQKTISARFGFAKGKAQLQYSVTQQDNAVVLEIGGAQGGLTVTWPESLVPDRSNPLLMGADATSVTFEADSSTRYAFTFLKTDPRKSYTDNDFECKAS